MRIKHCRRYRKYVSQQYCEFFNDGFDCVDYGPEEWNSIKDLLQDEGRPEREVKMIAKPLMCNLIDPQRLSTFNRKSRSGRRGEFRIRISKNKQDVRM